VAHGGDRLSEESTPIFSAPVLRAIPSRSDATEEKPGIDYISLALITSSCFQHPIMENSYFLPLTSSTEPLLT